MRAESYCKCTDKNISRAEERFAPILSSIFIVLLPKCPFCVLAYTSAITVCSAKNLSGHIPGWASYISIALSLFTFLVVAYNYKGFKTKVALGLILVGVGLIAYSELFVGLLGPYYAGSVLLMLGVWVNGSLFYFLNRISSIFRHHY